MWDAQIESLDDGRVQRFVASGSAGALSYADVIDLWCDDHKFRAYSSSLLAGSPFAAYRWEMPCVTAATVGREFEFVLLRCDGLARAVDTTAFASHFDLKSEVVTFSNLGGDAQLVVPCPVADHSTYGHLASFIRAAPKSQLDHLWQAIGSAMKRRISDQPVWLSTAGMGVSWLHVRLDDRPKYYGYSPYRSSH